MAMSLCRGVIWVQLCIVLASVSVSVAFNPLGSFLQLRCSNLHARDLRERKERFSCSAETPKADHRLHSQCLDRRSVLGAVPAFVIGTAFPSDAFQVPAGVVQQGKAAGETDLFLQHAVLDVEDLGAEVAFWTKGLGMKVLRKRAGTVFVGYGPESLDVEGGGHFALELTEKDEAAGAASGMQRVELLLRYTPALLVDAEEFGGSILPRWFGTANFVEVASPAGFVARISYTDKGQPSPYPVRALVQKVPDVGKAKAFLTSGLKLAPGGGFQLPFIGGDSATVQVKGQGGEGVGVALVVEALPKEGPPVKGKSLWKLAAVTSRRSEIAQQSEAAGGKVLFDGTAPGTATKVTLVEAAACGGLAVALVDVDGFKAEIPTAPALPPTPPPK